MKRFVAVFLLAGGLLVAGSANATVAITFAQVGNDVVATAVGSLTLPGVTSGPFANLPGIISAASPVGRLFFGNGTANYDYIDCLTPTNTGFGSSSTITIASSSTNDAFGILSQAGRVFLPSGFTSGGNINSTVTFPNITVASLGLTVGGTTYTCGTDTITVQGSAPAPTPSAVPTLSEWSQMLLGLLVMTMIGWQWRKQQSVGH